MEEAMIKMISEAKWACEAPVLYFVPILYQRPAFDDFSDFWN